MQTLAFSISMFIAVTTAIYLLVTHGIDNYRSYRRQFEVRVSKSLREHGLEIPVRRLFVHQICLFAVMSVIGFMLFSASGLITGALLVLVTPFVVMQRLRAKRRAAFLEQLPDALNALSSSMRAGATLIPGLESLAKWQPAPLAEEFDMVLSEYEFGASLEEALGGLHRRMQHPEVELFNSAILISRSAGGRLSYTLETLASTVAEKLAVEGKVDALTTAGRSQGFLAMMIPFIVGAAFYVLEPEKISYFYTERSGMIMLSIMITMLTLAFFSIRRIVKIDI